MNPKKVIRITAALVVSAAAQPARCANILYVYQASLNPIPPYETWLTGARSIQQAVDAAEDGDYVIVAPGEYDADEVPTPTGGDPFPDPTPNRVVIDKDVTVLAVTDAEFTVIRGRGPVGNDAVRCVYLSAGVLHGFTLTGGATRDSYDQKFGGGGAYLAGGGEIRSCVIEGNESHRGGGVMGGLVSDSLIRGNRAVEGAEYPDGWGGGAFQARLVNCRIEGNRAVSGGGVASLSRGTTLEGCTVSGNVARLSGGGCYGGDLISNCKVIDNISLGIGGGLVGASARNCLIAGNRAHEGGGAVAGTLIHCTVTANRADRGGGVFDSFFMVKNSIVYFNDAALGANWFSVGGLPWESCCTTPDADGFLNTVTESPQLIGPGRIAAASPCIGRGQGGIAEGVDLQGDPWLTPPSIGCDEPLSVPATGPLTVQVTAPGLQVAAGAPLLLTADIEGRATASRWLFHDGTIVSNRYQVARTWDEPGVYEVRVTAFNASNPAGVTGSLAVDVVDPAASAAYVWANAPAPQPPYRNWGQASRSIQAAVDAQPVIGGRVIVRDGVYAAGQSDLFGMGYPSRVVIDKDVVLKSESGPAGTVIEGAGTPGQGDAVRCVAMFGGRLEGLTLRHGASDGPGGGVFSPLGTVRDCVIESCHALFMGGGAAFGTYVGCTIQGNSLLSSDRDFPSTPPSRLGAGAVSGSLFDCILVGNRGGPACAGGGAADCELFDSWLEGNSAGRGGGAAGGRIRLRTERCAFVANIADQSGGGTADAWMRDCLLVGNSAGFQGGGMDGGYAVNCTVVGNSAGDRAGGASGNLRNSIVYYNSAPASPNMALDRCSRCCTTPDVAGADDLPNEPGFVDGFGLDFRLACGSPCIDAGEDAAHIQYPDVLSLPRDETGGPPVDFDGAPRFVDGDGDGDDRIDIGAFEFQGIRPDTAANGNDGPVDVAMGQPVALTIALDPGVCAGRAADWWILSETPFGWYHFDVAAGEWKPGFQVSYQGPLEELPPTEVFNGAGLPPGVYTKTFAVDTQPDGIFQVDRVFADTVQVVIGSAGSFASVPVR